MILRNERSRLLRDVGVAQGPSKLKHKLKVEKVVVK